MEPLRARRVYDLAVTRSPSPSAPLAVSLMLSATLTLGACSTAVPQADAPSAPTPSAPAPSASSLPASTPPPPTSAGDTAAPTGDAPSPTVTVTVTAPSTPAPHGDSAASVLSAQTWESFTYPRYQQSPITLQRGLASVRDTYFHDVAMPARLHSVVSGEVSGSPATLVALTVTDHQSEGWPDTLYLIYLFRATGSGVEMTASARAHDTTGASVRWTLGGGQIHQSVTHLGDDEWMGGPQSTWLVDGVVDNRGPQLYPPLHTRPDPMAGDS